MRLDRYVGEEPKFKVLRRQSDGTYAEVPAFEYFVLALKDFHAASALAAYASSAGIFGRDYELQDDVRRLARESALRLDRKMPD